LRRFLHNSEFMKYYYVLLSLLFSTLSFSQCFQIESVLVDACGPEEGLNEMVRFKIGNAAVNTSNLSVDWPNNNWTGLIQNAVTAQKVAALNADILAAGGCGQLLQPTGGVLPANATVILVTSHMMDTALNQFGPITSNIYIIFQNNNTVIAGHFANSGAGLRTLEISFGNCSDTVTYNRSLLIDENGVTTAGDGAAVEFTANGQATYINNGCSAPVPPFTVDAGANQSACAGTTVSLSGVAQGQQSVAWTASSGTFSNPGATATNFTIPSNATGTITLTLTATNSCGTQILDTLTINVTAATVPNFPTQLTICQGATAPVLATTSPNGITGTWNPSVINSTTSGNYIFTPNAGQCANPVTLTVTVTTSIVPDFQTQLTVCQGATAPALATTSPNGIVGTWNPSAINTSTSGNYIFTPNAGQCASPVTLTVTVTNSIVPDFATQLTICQGATAPVLATTSPNGIAGTWNPSAINTTTSGNYIFTPNAGQCAIPVTLTVTVTASVVPDFATQLTICQGATAPGLSTTSPNGIVGTWNPSAINTSTSGNYIFTPNAGQCASPVTLTVTVTNSIVPDFPTQLTICQGATAPVLATTSPNGITGTWNPSVINTTTSGSYVFTPDAGQCAQAATLTVTVGSLTLTVEGNCEGGAFILRPVAADFGPNPNYVWTNAAGTIVGQDETLNVSDIIEGANPQFPMTFTLTVETGSGCSASDDYPVDSIFCTIPKGVSVNGDGNNDTFDLSGLNVNQLRIFNRYGKEVYGRRDYTDQWKGQSDKNEELPDGTYYYVIDTRAGKVHTGWVYLLRKA